ncbi:shikimate dehydrogenase [Seleniivibrio woodruffii]|uniref:shikimate dehydrogenase n=1 Tax=Seleniivibrio woodruffii TaxID=1078050 RepID=UPI0039E4EF47
MFLNLALIGTPLSHSFSPFIQTRFLKNTGLNGGFCCFETEGGDALAQTLETLKHYSFRGFNVTVPHKEEIRQYLCSEDEIASGVGAVNVVLIDNGLKGFNTDVCGFEGMLKDGGCDMQGANVLLLGCGGASKAVLYSLKKSNVRLTVVNRDTAKAERVLSAMNFDSASIQDYNFIKSNINFDYVINGTSMGLKDGVFADMSKVECAKAALDLQYKKGLTPFLCNMRHCGCALLDGFPMLVYQAARAFEIWTGVRPPFTVAEIAGELGLNN